MVARGYASLSFWYSAAEAINELDVPAYIYLPMIGFLNGGSSWEYARWRPPSAKVSAKALTHRCACLSETSVAAG